MRDRNQTLITYCLLTLILSGLLLSGSAFAQLQGAGTQNQSTTTLPDAPAPNTEDTSEWFQVQKLSREDMITVRLRGGDTVRCVFDGATSNELSCSSPYGLTGGRGFHFDRSEVEVARQRHEHRNIVLMTLIGAGVGCTFFAAREESPKTVGRGVDCALGAGIGALGGSFIGLITRPFIPGSLIYRKRQGHQ
jgi:hypothetical protein